MSLTSELSQKNSFVRQFIQDEFPHIGDLCRQLNHQLGSIPNPTVTYDKRTASLVGTAFDYRVRSYFSDEPQKSVAIQAGVRSMNLLYSMAAKDGEIIRSAWNESAAQSLFEALKQFIRHARPKGRRLPEAEEEYLCRFCALLAQLDNAGRMIPSENLARAGSVASMLSRIEEGVAHELMALSYLFHERHASVVRNFKHVFVGQTLAGSGDVGGADFDLIVDGCLFEIKTRGKFKIVPEFVWQLIGYWLLDYNDKFRIRSGAIYLSRQGYLHNFDLKRDLLRTRRPMEHIRIPFRNRLSNYAWQKAQGERDD